MVKIDEEFKSLIPPLSDEERQQLERNIIEDGCRDPLVVWGDILIDGHNRFDVCLKHSIKFSTVSKDFASRDAAKVWMIDNQKGRRNLTDGWKFELAQTRKSLLMEKGREKYEESVGRPKKSLSKVDNEKHNTRQELAKELGWSTGKVAMADKVWKEAAPEVKEKIKSGETSINEAYKKLTVHVANNSGENEWYTPKEFIDRARLAMGEIDLDPASCELAQEYIKAVTFYDCEENGLECQWFGRVWLNPPYSKDLCGKFTEKLVDSFAAGDVVEAVVLVNNATETTWMQRLFRECSAVCFPAGRIKFLDSSGKPANSPLQGQAFIYLGTNQRDFSSAFSDCGTVFFRSLSKQIKDVESQERDAIDSWVRRFAGFENKFLAVKELLKVMDCQVKNAAKLLLEATGGEE